MKSTLLKTYILVFIVFFFADNFYSQSTYGPKESDLRRDLIRKINAAQIIQTLSKPSSSQELSL